MVAPLGGVRLDPWALLTLGVVVVLLLGRECTNVGDKTDSKNNKHSGTRNFILGSPCHFQGFDLDYGRKPGIGQAFSSAGIIH